jgi:hypothetical protein
MLYLDEMLAEFDGIMRRVLLADFVNEQKAASIIF